MVSDSGIVAQNPYVWQCSGCKNAIRADLEVIGQRNKRGHRIDFYWEGSRHACYATGCAWEYPLRFDEPGEELYTIDGKGYCPECATECSNCNAHLFRDSDSTEHSAFPYPGEYSKRSVCVDCLYEIEGEQYEEAIDDWRTDLRRAADSAREYILEYRRLSKLQGWTGEGLPGRREPIQRWGWRWDARVREWTYNHGSPRLPRKLKSKLRKLSRIEGKWSKIRWQQHWGEYRPGVQEAEVEAAYQEAVEAVQKWQQVRRAKPSAP